MWAFTSACILCFFVVVLMPMELLSVHIYKTFIQRGQNFRRLFVVIIIK